ncbi:unnamed protein product [Protopolystoma xenopodis]|uniref:SURP motif domain-containing protein n=1 Tax=Protopolystoma xenopodis TaxID=117903 RepID=A0A3S4ZS68_9PLAT|nr:unnamed protein product [Protopolystoma xenopodis]
MPPIENQLSDKPITPKIGIIYPPPEVRNIVDKTASFVARNGPDFESRIRQNEINNPKFNFLNPVDPYHSYYQHKVRDFTEGRGQEPQVSKGQPNAARLVQEPTKLMPEPFVPKNPPLEFEFVFDPPSINALDIDIIKLTAQFVARNGRQFLSQLMNREQRNYQFDFLRAQHSMFSYFTKLVEQYTKILIPPKDIIKNLEIEFEDPKKVLEQVKYRVEWFKFQERQRKKEEEAAERERIAYAQIDWHDFVVVETVDFQPNEAGNFPLPTTPEEVGARVIAEERRNLEESSVNESAPESSNPPPPGLMDDIPEQLDEDEDDEASDAEIDETGASDSDEEQHEADIMAAKRLEIRAAEILSQKTASASHSVSAPPLIPSLPPLPIPAISSASQPPPLPPLLPSPTPQTRAAVSTGISGSGEDDMELSDEESEGAEDEEDADDAGQQEQSEDDDEQDFGDQDDRQLSSLHPPEQSEITTSTTSARLPQRMAAAPHLPGRGQSQKMPGLPQVIVRHDYDPKAARNTGLARQDVLLVSPFTGEKIPAAQAPKHIRVGLLNPKWIEQRDREIREKRETDQVYASGGLIESSLKQLAERRTDIFGVGVDETAIGRKLGEEPNDSGAGKSEKLIWDGHAISSDMIARRARDAVTPADQLKLLEHQRHLEATREKIGVQAPSGTLPTSLPPIVLPPIMAPPPPPPMHPPPPPSLPPLPPLPPDLITRQLPLFPSMPPPPPPGTFITPPMPPPPPLIPPPPLLPPPDEAVPSEAKRPREDVSV